MPPVFVHRDPCRKTLPLNLLYLWKRRIQKAAPTPNEGGNQGKVLGCNVIKKVSFEILHPGFSRLIREKMKGWSDISRKDS